MKPLDHRRSIDAYKFNHTANVIKKIVPQGSILEQLMIFAGSVPDQFPISVEATKEISATVSATSSF